MSHNVIWYFYYSYEAKLAHLAQKAGYESTEYGKYSTISQKNRAEV